MGQGSHKRFTKSSCICRATKEQLVGIRDDGVAIDLNNMWCITEQHSQKLQKGSPCVNSCSTASSRKSRFWYEHKGTIASWTILIVSITCGRILGYTAGSVTSDSSATWYFVLLFHLRGHRSCRMIHFVYAQLTLGYITFYIRREG